METHDTWTIIESVIATSRRVLLHGLPGTGKTYAAATRNVPEGIAVYQMTMTPETPAAEPRGHYLPKGSEFVWQDGPGTTAWRPPGARLVINEIEKASDDALTFLNALLDDPEFAEITLPTGEVIKPAEGFHVVATMNGHPYDLPSSLQDRFPVTIEVLDVNPEAIAALPEDLRIPARESALVTNEDRRLSIRMWMEFASLRLKLAAQKDSETEGTVMAAEAIFGRRAKEALRAIKFNEYDEAS